MDNSYFWLVLALFTGLGDGCVEYVVSYLTFSVIRSWNIDAFEILEGFNASLSNYELYIHEVLKQMISFCKLISCHFHVSQPSSLPPLLLELLAMITGNSGCILVFSLFCPSASLPSLTCPASSLLHLPILALFSSRISHTLRSWTESDGKVQCRNGLFMESSAACFQRTEVEKMLKV